MTRENLRHRSTVIGLILLLTFLPSLALIASAGELVGVPFPIRAEIEVELNPAIAYNSQWQEYLVVLWNDRPGCDDIRAERVARDGRLLGGRWIAAGCPAERRHPDVAYNRQRNEYLVVWAEISGGYSFVQAQRFTADLQPQPEGVQTLIAGTFGMYTSSYPAVAYAYTSDKYLVVWELEVNMPPAPMATSIAGHVVLGNGTKDPAGSFNVSLDPGGFARQRPDVAYNLHANRYLVVWQQWAGALWDIHGQQVHGGGGLFQGDITIAYYNKSSTAPAVAALHNAPTNDKFLVVWEVLYVPPSDRDIYGRLVAEDGTPHKDFWISWANAVDESSPAVASDEAGQRYLVAWRHPLGVVDIPIHARAISTDGNLLYDTVEAGGPTADYPAVAAGLAGTFLVAWQDKAPWATHTDIYGQFWGNWAYVPLVVRNR